MENLTALKDQGNEAFKRSDFGAASSLYGKCLEAIDVEARKAKGALDTDPAVTLLQVNVLCNRAACALKTDHFQACVTDCTRAVELDPVCIKALFRRAQAFGQLDDVVSAFEDLKRLLRVEPNNKAARQLVQKLKERAAEKSTVRFQVMEKLKATGQDPTERLKNLRQVLGSLNEDADLGKEILRGDGLQVLWDTASDAENGEPFATIVLARLCEDKADAGVAKAIADIVDTAVVLGWAKDPENEPKYRAASLTLVHQIVAHEASPELSLLQDFTDALVECIRSPHELVQQSAMDTVVRTCSDKDRAELFVQLGGMDALLESISGEKGSRQRAAVVLGRVLPALDSDKRVQELALALCRPALKSGDPVEMLRGVSALNAIFFANNELGVWLMEQSDMMETLLELAQRAPSSVQAIVVDVLALMANTEKGRVALQGPPSDILQLLIHSDHPGVRSGAAVTMTKLNAVDFDPESSNGMVVLSSVMTLLSADCSLEEKAKGVEAVSFVITDTDVKEMVCLSSNAEIMNLLTTLAQDPDTPKHSYCYGLAYIFENLTMNEDDKKREKLREMEVTAEQWEQFEKITKMDKKKGRRDNADNVQARIESFVLAGGAVALRALIMNGSSDGVLNSAAHCFANVATVNSVRGKLVAQGAFRALLRLCDVGADVADKVLERRRRDATHAIAKILITTDPHLLPDAQLMDACGPMIHQVRHSDQDLVIFECLMALTNLATLSPEAKAKIVSLRAIPAFEYAQFSDEIMVRRAATEALCNVIGSPEMHKWMCNPEKMRLWLLFAEDYESDLATSRAACGALANLSFDPKVAKVMVKGEAVRKLVSLMASGLPEIIHRVLVVLQGLAANSVDGRKELESKPEIRVMVELAMSCGAAPVEAAAKATLAALDGPQPVEYLDEEEEEVEDGEAVAAAAATAHGPARPPAPPATEAPAAAAAAAESSS